MAVVVGVGSNLGDRLVNVNAAVLCLQNERGIEVVNMSRLYCTKAMYVKDQPDFINGVLELNTTLAAMELLKVCKRIEQKVGRVPSVRYGPRAVDLDILLYKDESVHMDEELIVPHPRMLERGFVLGPLSEMMPNYQHPKWEWNVKEYYAQLGDTGIKTILPVGEGLFRNENTVVMGILNCTPDSFSDGGENEGLDVVMEKVQQMVELGCAILDVGGESSRPDAEGVSVEEEMKRIGHLIRNIRERFPGIGISVDTTKAKVARMAIQMGASMVNDISGGRYDQDMLDTVAKLGVPIVLMHSRGTASTMKDLKQYEDVVEDVARELWSVIDSAKKAGIPTWNIIVDPGIGFAKGLEENIRLLKHMDTFVEKMMPYPVLIGASRKAFIGHLTGKTIANQRDIGTAATTCAAIQGGAKIIRVHNVPITMDIVNVYDAIIH